LGREAKDGVPKTAAQAELLRESIKMSKSRMVTLQKTEALLAFQIKMLSKGMLPKGDGI
jgi:hypothetical protein